MSNELATRDGAYALRRIERWLAVIALCFMVMAASAALVAYEASTVGEKLNEMRQDRRDLLERLESSRSQPNKL
jgi:hypothetical protein